MDSRVTFKDAAQKSRHAARAARFTVDFDDLEILARDENGDEYAMNAPVESLGELAEEVRSIGVSGGIAQGLAEEIAQTIEARRVEYDIKNVDRVRVAEGLSKSEALDYLDEHGAELKTVTLWEGDEVLAQAYATAFVEEGGVPPEHDAATDGRLAALRNRENRKAR